MEAIDDDFGELYADVEVQASSTINGISDFSRLYIEPEKDNGDGAKDKAVKVEEDFVSDEKEVDSACGEDSTHSGSEGLELNSGKEVNDCIESDSEDDLHIVLNDSDCQDYPGGVGVGGNRGVVTGASYDEDDDGDFVAEGSNLGKNGNYGSEMVSCNGHSGQSKNVVKRDYGSHFFQHKYIRTRQSAFVNNITANNSMAIAYYSSPLIKCGRNGTACNKNQASTSCNVARDCAAANPLVVQRGYGSFLPRYWSIFDVNIDNLEDKPWRIPGVDITNYFNFGFNENTWKEYCASLEKLWLATAETSTTINEASNSNQEAMREQLDQVVSGSLLPSSSECEVPRGRAIQVEDGMGERQPSIDVRRPRSRDSDVVIQIKVLESSDDCSDSGHSNVHEASEEIEFNADNNRNILSSGIEHDDELSGDHLEDEKKSDDSSVLKRHGSSSSGEKVENQNQIVQPSEDAEEALKDKTKAEEGVCVDTCSADPCSIDSELSFGDHDLSLTSYSDSESEATKNSLHVDNEKSQTPLTRQSVNSVTDLKESASSYHETSKSNSYNKKLIKKDYRSRYKGPARQEQRHQSARRQPNSKRNKHVDIDNEYAMPGATGLSLLDHEFVDYDKKELVQDFSIHKRRDVSYYRETERSSHYGSEKVVDELFHTVYDKYPDGESRGSFRENRNRFVRKYWDEREYFSEHRSPMAHDVGRDRDRYHADQGHLVDDANPISYWESSQFLSKHYSFPAKERATGRRIYETRQFRDRNGNVGDHFDERKNEFINRSYGMPTFTESEIEFLDHNQEEPFPHIDRKLERSARRDRHCDQLPLDLDGLWSGKVEDECQEYTCHRALNFQSYRQCDTVSHKYHVHDKELNNKFGGCWRQKYDRKDRTNDWYCGYNDADEDEDCIIHPVKEYEFERGRYSSPSEVLHWTEDEFASGQQDELYDEEALFSYERTSRYERTHARYGSLFGKMQIDHTQLQHHQLNMPQVGSQKRSSKIISTGNRVQTVQRCRNSIDFVNREEKSYGRSSGARNLVCNGRLENLDRGIAKKRTTIVAFDESHKRAIRSDISKSGGDHNKRKYPKNTLDKLQKGLDIEEGQIVTEEPCVEASVPRKVVSESSPLNDSVKKRMLQKENNSDREKNAGGFDSHRILDTLAKMEKRRERFKELITTKKEAEPNMKLNVELSSKIEDYLVIDTDTMKPHRPARKRRWAGS